MAWQFNTVQPIHIQISHKILSRIFSGEYPPGERIPSVRDLAIEAGVNPNTMQKAFAELERIGVVLTTNRTAGRIVTTDADIVSSLKIETARSESAEFIARLKNYGLSSGQISSLLGEIINKGE